MEMLSFNQSHFVSPWRVVNLWCENYESECAQNLREPFSTHEENDISRNKLFIPFDFVFQ